MSNDNIESKDDNIENEGLERTNSTNSDENQQEANISTGGNILFNSQEDLVTKDGYSISENKVTYFGIESDSQYSAIVNLISSAIGGGCLHFSDILQHLGFPITSLIFLFVTFSIYYTMNLLRRFVVDTKYFSFALMTSKILGKNWLKVYAICSLIFYLSIVIYYISEIYNLVLNIINISADYEYIININYFVVTIILEIIICSYISNTQKILLFSIISLLLFSLILFLIILEGIISVIKGTDKLDYNKFINPETDNYLINTFEIMSYINEFIFGYSYHSSYPTLLSNLKKVNEKYTKKSHIYSFIFISSSYFLMTLFGYLMDYNLYEILFSKDLKAGKVQIIIFKIFICLFLFSTIPLRFVVIRDNYSSLINQNENLSFKIDLLLVCICIIFCNLIAYFTNGISNKYNFLMDFIEFFSCIFGVIIGFVLPVVLYVGANGMWKVKSIIGYVIAGIFCLIGTLSVGYSIFLFATVN